MRDVWLNHEFIFFRMMSDQVLQALGGTLWTFPTAWSLSRMIQCKLASHAWLLFYSWTVGSMMINDKRGVLLGHLVWITLEWSPCWIPYRAGFVVFYDFLLGLCPSYRVCRLVAMLSDRGQEIGASSPLPVVYCEPASLSPHAPQHSIGNLATLAAKQAVPRWVGAESGLLLNNCNPVCSSYPRAFSPPHRVFPSLGVSLLLELQASEGCDLYGQQVSGLLSRGWVKVDVFDAQNHLISGKWKVPVRVLPIRPTVTTMELNAVPQVTACHS